MFYVLHFTPYALRFTPHGVSMAEYTLVATAAFGLEAVVARELKLLGYENTSIENGRVSFSGTERDIARTNIWLRCADRVLIKMGQFRASDFEELFQGVRSIPWDRYVPATGAVNVTGRSIKSILTSVPACQSIVKKAIMESMKNRYRLERFPEDGPAHAVDFSLEKDVVSVYMDTTGQGLHKRGYRTGTGQAALKETLAAGLVILSRWKPGVVFLDPFCGSGTIAIEAAMIGRNIAPGINRGFASEQWKFIDLKIWDEERRRARKEEKQAGLNIRASDIDDTVIAKARHNARHAGVLPAVTFERREMKDLTFHEEKGIVICNPPYGERSGDTRAAGELMKKMRETFDGARDWSFFIFTGLEDFEKYYGKPADSNRKLYNGRIKCYLYGYTAGNRQ
jgi:putative N6-adenine-specific DNA methylase